VRVVAADKLHFSLQPSAPENLADAFGLASSRTSDDSPRTAGDALNVGVFLRLVRAVR